MINYTIRRLLSSLPTLIIVAVLVFILIRMVPGNPALVMLGEEATPGRLREYQEFQKTQKARDDKRQKSAEEMKKKLGGKLVSVKVSAGEGGKLFGSVTSAQVAEALSAQFGAGIDKKDIKLDESIKQAGSYAFRIKLYPGVEAEMTLKVESE